MSASIGQKHNAIRGNNSHSAVDISKEIQHFIAAMTGAEDFDSDITGKKPLVSCFAFTATENGSETIPVLVSTTVHFPMDAYVTNDEEAKRRIEAYYDLVSVADGSG